MLKIRLQRSGRSKRPYYRVVLTEHSSPVKSAAILTFGGYDPLQKDGLKVDTQAVLEWVKKGAQPSNTVARLLLGAGVKEMKPFVKGMADRKVKNPKEEPEAPVPAAEEKKEVAPEAETPAEAPAEEKKEDTAPPAEDTPSEAAEEPAA